MNGMYSVNGVWGYYVKGIRQNSYTGMATNDYGSWYFKNGQIAFSYTGTVTINKVKYNVVKGQVK